MKLFRVTCRGMQQTHGAAYVVANTATEAYELLREDLDTRNLGFVNERELAAVELLADERAYPECGRRLYIEQEPR